MMHRRHFLKASAGTLLAPFVWPRRAFGQAFVPNLVLLTWPDGLEPGWQPDRDADNLGARLQALEPYREDVLVIDGLIGCIDSELNAHNEGPASMWTGSRPVDGLSSLESIDHTLARRVGGNTAFDKLHFGVQSGREGVIGNATPVYYFSGPQASVPSEDDPQVMYDRIFAAALEGTNPVELQNAFARRGSALDFARDRINTLRGRIASQDRPRLDQHLSAVESIERSLQRLRNLTCEIQLDRPGVGGLPARDEDATFESVADLQADLMVAALQCGLTKIATFQLSQTDSALKLPNWVAALHSAMHDHPRADRIVINRWFMDFIARLIGKFKAVQVGEERTLLDETLIVCTTEMAIGNHGNDPIPYIIAGGGGSTFRLGRVLRLEGEPRNTRLLTSILHAMGQTDIQSVGDFRDERSLGALEEVRG